MAKIGNESKLILKLAEQQTEDKRQKILVGKDYTSDFLLGYETGRNDYKHTLANIVEEIEQR